jgi:PTS system ascorbate-specific IIA component
MYMLSQWINDDTIQIHKHVPDWQQALEICARPLLNRGIITPGYLTAIVAQQQKMGPYYVIAPGLAMPHARPEEGAQGLGLSLLKLHEGVLFNAQEFDPVDLIIMLAAPDKYSHIELISALAQLFSSEEDLSKLRHAATMEDIKAIIQKF